MPPAPPPHLRPSALLSLSFALAGCSDHDHAHGGGGAAHDAPGAGQEAGGAAGHDAPAHDDGEHADHGPAAHAPDDHGHGDHDHAGGEDDPRPTLSLTVTTTRHEAFVELPSLVVGQPSRLLAHLTSTAAPGGFVAVTAGSLRAALRFDAGGADEAVADGVLRPGIFAPTLTPSRAGPARLVLTLDGPMAGEVDLGPVTVHPSAAAAQAAAPPEEEPAGLVPFLKEAQWQVTFATAPVVEAPLRDAVRATGQLLAPPEAHARVDSPAAGRFTPAPGLRVGARVEAGALLGTVSPLAGPDGGAARAEVEAARAQEALARAALQRAEALHPAVVSARELEAARAGAQVAAAQRAAAEGRQRAWAGGAGGGAELRAPRAGVVAFVHAAPGQALAPGAPVAEVVDASTLWVQADVFAAELPRVRATSGALVEVPGRAEAVAIDPASGGAVLAVGVAADPVRRTVPVLFSLPNPGDLVPGTPVQVRVYGEVGAPRLAVPHTAVVDDRGAEVVFVQVGGESFARRRVRLGPRDGGLVAVLEGLAAGERVVSLGAYELLLSSAGGGIPAHGHGH